MKPWISCSVVSMFLYLGMIAIPDFAAGAMENWGLITYRETDMLYEPGVSSERNLQRVKTVIAHELAHQVISLELPAPSISLKAQAYTDSGGAL